MALLQCDDEQVVKAGPGVGAHINNVGVDNLDEGPDHFARGNTHELVLLGRLSDNGCRINSVASLCDLADVEYRKLTCIGIMTKVVAEWPFNATFTSRNS